MASLKNIRPMITLNTGKVDIVTEPTAASAARAASSDTETMAVNRPDIMPLVRCP